MEFGKAVWYVGDGDKKDLAFVTATAEDGTGNLVVLTDNGVAKHNGVARRAPKDFGEEGGGHTWHLQSESE